MVVDFSTARLDDVNIFLPDRLLNFNPSLTDGKFGEQNLCGRDTQHTANSLSQLRVGVSSNDNKVANHGVWLCRCNGRENW